MDSYRVILADDHFMFRLGMKKILEEVKGIEVIGEANDGHELLSLVKSLTPHLVILDISMPKLRGIEATREIKTNHPDIKVVILTMHNNMEYLQHSIAAGADGYVLKQDAGTELFSAIKTVRNGGVFISSTFLIELTVDFVKKCRGDLTQPVQTLTSRQREVVKLIAEGKTNKAIGDLLCISVRTVEKHRANIMEKLHLKTTADIVKYAIQKKYTFVDR